MPDIEFTQYVLPHGRRKPVSIDRPQPIFDKAQEIIANGYCFECEILTTGHVSVTIADPEEELDVAIKVVGNDSAVPAAIDEMIMEFNVAEALTARERGYPS